LIQEKIKPKTRIGFDGYSYKKTMLGSEIVNIIFENCENKLTELESFKIAELLYKNCVFSNVPYETNNRFDNDKMYCFIVIFYITLDS
jgi:hypothetical protein